MDYEHELYHYGILGMKWGIRRYQNKDGSLTEAGRDRYGIKKNINEIIEKRVTKQREWYDLDDFDRMDEAGVSLIGNSDIFNALPETRAKAAVEFSKRAQDSFEEIEDQIDADVDSLRSNQKFGEALAKTADRKELNRLVKKYIDDIDEDPEDDESEYGYNDVLNDVVAELASKEITKNKDKWLGSGYRDIADEARKNIQKLDAITESIISDYTKQYADVPLSKNRNEQYKYSDVIKSILDRSDVHDEYVVRSLADLDKYANRKIDLACTYLPEYDEYFEIPSDFEDLIMSLIRKGG